MTTSNSLRDFARKVGTRTLLCVSSVSSASPWFTIVRKNNHRDTEDTEVAQRKSSATSFFCEASLCLLRLFAANPNLPLAQNLFLKRISKLKLFVRALSLLVEACSYCATNESRYETRYSSARIWLGSEVTFVE